MADSDTLATYARKARDYADLTGAALRADPLLAAFIQALPKGGHVLDLGCGPGHAAEVMADAGLLVSATDAVPEMIALVPAHPGIAASIATFDEIDGHAIYDGIWANFSLLHAERADMPRHLAALHRAIKLSGRMHIALKSGTAMSRDTLGRRYTYYEQKELTALLGDAGFTVDSCAQGRDVGLDGTPADWIALCAYG